MIKYRYYIDNQKYDDSENPWVVGPLPYVSYSNAVYDV